MDSAFEGGELVLATHNKGKVREFEAMFQPRGVTIRSAADLGLAEPEETGSTFEANAILKAEAAMVATGLPALADDSGLAVAGLDGAPGIYSARWAGPGGDFNMAIARVFRELEGRYGSFAAAPKEAAFIAVLALAWPDGRTLTFPGVVDGRIVEAPRGEGGFGYDPIFIPLGHTQTFGQMSAADKHKISHRRRAIDAMVKALFAES
ncbi:XTP/dITP diphosphohydrolase [Arboricoccus pini]|uniref:dITP/XTP pyrophosphatase n=1 Tax=Arboricoccus pini TaxID=1963835 RepID=A0A212PZV0_9PROT|nr:RdgB/HAM1 family non-canonical purine NTP pyrophosphatase [Arboricoccus pini]SNB52592.1 XTP/dITP diphosphohydrolase [Arboricoccus pini]